MQNFKMAAKNGMKTIFCEMCMTVVTPWVKNFVNRYLWVKSFFKNAVSPTISKISTFSCFTQKFKMAAKNGGTLVLAEVTVYNLLA